MDQCSTGTPSHQPSDSSPTGRGTLSALPEDPVVEGVLDVVDVVGPDAGRQVLPAAVADDADDRAAGHPLGDAARRCG